MRTFTLRSSELLENIFAGLLCGKQAVFPEAHFDEALQFGRKLAIELLAAADRVVDVAVRVERGDFAQIISA